MKFPTKRDESVGDGRNHEVTYIAMNSMTESLRCESERSAVISVADSPFSTLPTGGTAFSQELNATSLVYSQPILRQNL